MCTGDEHLEARAGIERGERKKGGNPCYLVDRPTAPLFSLSSFSKPFLPVGRATTLWTETRAERGWKKQISTIAGGEFPIPPPLPTLSIQRRRRFSARRLLSIAFRKISPRHSVYSETLCVKLWLIASREIVSG